MDIRFKDTGNTVILIIDKRKVIVARYIDNVPVLCRQFAILNSLFTYPISYIPPLPRPLPSNTIFTSTYYSTGLIPGCKYLTFSPVPNIDDNLQLSRVVSPRRELIQLYQLDMKYTINYSINCGYVQFLVISQQDNKAYPLVDTKGFTTGKLTGNGYITVSYYQLIVIKTFDDIVPNVKLVVTGAYNNPIAGILGTIILKLRFNSSVITVPIAFKDKVTGIRTPVKGLTRLAGRLFNINRSMFSSPCTQIQQTVIPPGPYTITVDPPSTDTSINLRNLSLVSYEFGGVNDPYFIFKYQPLNVISPYWSLGSIFPVGDGTALWLKNFIVGTTYGGTYHLRYDIIVNYPKPVNPNPEITNPSLFMAGQSGDFFNDYLPLCNGSIARDTNGIVNISGDNITVHYNNTWVFSNDKYNYFEIGFFPGVSTSVAFTGDWTIDPTSFIFLEITSLVTNC